MSALKNNKACGIDEISTEVLKCKRLCNILLNLFNECCKKGLIPSIWKHRVINPIPKSSTSDPDKKAYDSVNRHNSRSLEIAALCGKMYKSLMAIYDNVKCTVRINGKLTDWFSVGCGLKQGCSLYSILFNLYIDDLVIRINALSIGIDIGGEMVGNLLCADDVVLLGENEADLQTLLNELNLWCKHNEMTVNASESKIIHFRTQSTQCTEVTFICGIAELET